MQAFSDDGLIWFEVFGLALHRCMSVSTLPFPSLDEPLGLDEPNVAVRPVALHPLKLMLQLVL